MTAILVPTIKTSYSKEDLIKSFILSWKELFGEIPSKESIAILLAQHNCETGEFSNYSWNNNLFNVKANLNENIEYMFLNNVWEMISGKKVIFQPPNPACAFRSFTTLTDGVKFQLNLLKNGRYKSAWQFIESGDPKSFVKALKDAHYFTASLESYTNLVMNFFNKHMKDQTYENVIKNLPTQEINLGDLIHNMYDEK